MKLLHIQRKTKIENRFSIHMGRLVTKVTYINKCILGFPVKTLHKYRETYYGEIKDCNECYLFI